MDRPKAFAEHRFLGDKRTQLVYDLDEFDDQAVIAELMDSERFLCFGPDTLAEARTAATASPGVSPADPRVADIGEELVSFPSGDGQIMGTVFTPAVTSSTGRNGVIVLHGFPLPSVGAENAGVAYTSLALRITSELDWPTMSFTYRGCGGSEGQFSLAGWREDAAAAIALFRSRFDLKQIFLVGFGTGAALAICAAADDPAVSGVAAFSPPADFSDWAEDPHQLLTHCRQLGLITDATFPDDFAAWSGELKTASADEHIERVAPRPTLLVHGADDEIVPVFDARVIADSHGSTELRILEGAGHGLRFDPRAVAILLGWLDRQT